MPTLPAPEPLDIEIGPEDKLLPVGRVSAVIGPTIVVQVRCSACSSAMLFRNSSHCQLLRYLHV